MRITAARRNALVDALGASFASAYLRIYSGTRPATADTALDGNTLLAELRFGASAFGASVAGVASATTITSEFSAPASGAASFARVVATDGSTALADASVGVGSGEVQLSTLDIETGSPVSCSACTLSMAVGA